MQDQIVDLFVQVLMICDEMKLIGREMFAIDGCKLPSNPSKQWSGARQSFGRKMAKMKKQAAKIVQKHRQSDKSDSDEQTKVREKQYKQILEKKTAGILTGSTLTDQRIVSYQMPLCF